MREERDHVVYAPGFERDLEQPIAGALGVPPEAELVVTEGNYLLLDQPEWRAVRAELDEVVHLVTDDAVRRARLVARHVEFGKSPAEAEAWVAPRRRRERRAHRGGGAPRGPHRPAACRGRPRRPSHDGY